MTLYTTAELAALRSCQESFMDDVCQVGVTTTTQDAIGGLTETITYGAAQACGLEMLAGQAASRAEYRTADGTIVNADARLRIAHDAGVTVTDRIKITTRHGEVLSSALVYEVLGEPAVGVSGTVCYLRRVTT